MWGRAGTAQTPVAASQTSLNDREKRVLSSFLQVQATGERLLSGLFNGIFVLMKKKETDIQDLANNKRAYHDFEIQETYEAGIALSGSEVKSCRKHSINFTDAYAEIRAGEVFLKNVNIAPYHFASNNPNPIRTRKLLLHKAQIIRIAGKLSQKGLTMIPLKMYLSGSLIKVQLGLARGKRQYEKRDDIKKREAQAEIDRAMTRSVKDLYK